MLLASSSRHELVNFVLEHLLDALLRLEDLLHYFLCFWMLDEIVVDCIDEIEVLSPHFFDDLDALNWASVLQVFLKRHGVSTTSSVDFGRQSIDVLVDDIF